MFILANDANASMYVWSWEKKMLLKICKNGWNDTSLNFILFVLWKLFYLYSYIYYSTTACEVDVTIWLHGKELEKIGSVHFPSSLDRWLRSIDSIVLVLCVVFFLALHDVLLDSFTWTFLHISSSNNNNNNLSRPTKKVGD